MRRSLLKVLGMVLLISSLATLSMSAEAASVTKARDCHKHSECSPAAFTRGRIDVESGRIKFFDGMGNAIKERTLLDTKSSAGFQETADVLPESVGVIVRKWKPIYEGMEDISHEIFDSNGVVIAEIAGKDVPEVVRPAPDLSYYLGWSSYMGSEGEPFVFFDSAGKVQKRVDGVFCAAGMSQCGGGVEVAFSPIAKLVAISVEGRGLSVFSSDGTLRWKKVIPGWSGRQPKFLPSGDRFVIVGEITRIETDTRIKDGTLKWEDVLKLPLEERQKLLTPKAVYHEGKALYCYSTDSDTPAWFVPGWAGTNSVHPTEDLVAAGSALGKDHFRVGLFNRNGLVRTWETPRAKASPNLSWTNRHPLLIFEEVTYPAKGGRTVKVRRPNGVRALHIFDRDKDKPIWTKDGSKKGFEYEPAGNDKFILSDETGKALFEVK